MWEGQRCWIVIPGALFLVLTGKRGFGEQPGIILITSMLILSLESTCYNLLIYTWL